MLGDDIIKWSEFVYVLLAVKKKENCTSKMYSISFFYLIRFLYFLSPLPS